MFVPQQEAWVVERMGKFNKILSPVKIFILQNFEVFNFKKPKISIFVFFERVLIF